MAAPPLSLNPTQIPPPTRETEEASIVGLANTVRSYVVRRFSFGLREPDTDTVEQWLRTNNSKIISLNDYRKLKQVPGKDIIEALTRYYVFDALSTWPVAAAIEEGHEADNARRSNTTLSQALDDFNSKLSAGLDPALRICALSMELPEALRSGLFKFRDKVFCTNDQMNARYKLPSRCIVSLIHKEWDSSSNRYKTWIKIPSGRNISYAPQLSTLPSTVSTLREFSLFKDRTENSATSFTWVSRAPVFYGNFYEYIWQRQNQPPPIERLVFSTSSTNVPGSKNIFIAIDSDQIPVKGKRCAEILCAFHKHFVAVLPQTPCSIEAVYLGALFSVLMVLAETTNDYINSVSVSISKMCYEGRRRPSGSKLHYLSHVEDSRKIAADSVQDALTLVAGIKISLAKSIDPTLTDETPLRFRLSDIESDLNFLKEKLEVVQNQLVSLQSMLKEKLDLRQIRRTYILTVLAAIYLPFSLMTSFYGMNVSDPIWPSKNDSSKKPSSNNVARDTAPPSDNSSSFSSEQTSAIVAAIQGSGSHLWTFQSYWYITIPVTITTIIVPMVIGIIIRWVSRFAFYYRGYWRLIVITGVALLVAMSDILMNRLLAQYSMIWLIVLSILLGVPALSLTCKSFIMKRHRLRWCGFTISVAIFPPVWWYNYDLFSNYFSIYIPFVYLYLLWIRHDLRDIYLAHRADRRCRLQSSRQDSVTAAEEGHVQRPQSPSIQGFIPTSGNVAAEMGEQIELVDRGGSLPVQGSPAT